MASTPREVNVSSDRMHRSDSTPNDRYINDHEAFTPSNSMSTTMPDSLSTVSQSSPFFQKEKPSSFERPTLGRVVLLGELFDERSNKFLGARLYKDEAIKDKVIITDAGHTDFTLSQSNSVKDKSNILDIDASLSLDVLSGLVPVRGLGSYLTTPKTNSQEQSWAMALRMRTEEHRLLFAELPDSTVVEEGKDYIPAATHFVSAIVYGGNLIINLTERASGPTQEDNIRGAKLRLELDQLKAAVSLERGAAADVKSKFKSLDNRFHVVMYGDIFLHKTPSSPTDILDILPHAVDLIHGNPRGAPEAGANNNVAYRVKGVPISVTLQPIPAELRAQNDFEVFRLKPWFVEEALSIFGKLDDLRDRFTALMSDTTVHRGLIPKLADRVQASFDAFDEEYRRHLRLLGQFRKDIQHGDHKKSEVNDFEIYSYPKAKKLLSSHTTVTDTTNLLIHEFPLVCLEKSFKRFQNFVYDISRAPSGLEDQHGNQLPSKLSKIDDVVCRVPRHQSIIPLFVMTPSLDHHDANYAAILFQALLRIHKTFHPRYLVYLEDTSDEEVLPHAKAFLNLDGPAYFLGKVNVDGDVMWTRDEEDNPPVPGAFMDS